VIQRFVFFLTSTKMLDDGADTHIPKSKTGEQMSLPEKHFRQKKRSKLPMIGCSERKKTNRQQGRLDFSSPAASLRPERKKDAIGVGVEMT